MIRIRNFAKRTRQSINIAKNFCEAQMQTTTLDDVGILFSGAIGYITIGRIFVSWCTVTHDHGKTWTKSHSAVCVTCPPSISWHVTSASKRWSFPWVPSVPGANTESTVNCWTQCLTSLFWPRLSLSQLAEPEFDLSTYFSQKWSDFAKPKLRSKSEVTAQQKGSAKVV